MNIAEIKQLADKEWVNGPVKGTISSAKNWDKGPSTAVFSDGNDSIKLKGWDKDLHRLNNKEVVLSGQGMRKDSYKGEEELVISEKTKITVEGTVGGTASPGKKAAPGGSTTPTNDDDYVPQTLAYFIGDAARIAVSMPDSDGLIKPAQIATIAVQLYEAREMAVEMIRNPQ